MTDYKNLVLENRDGILTVTISRIDALNALSFDTIEELKVVFKDIYDNDEIKGVIITGEGEKAFVAGADINEFSSLSEVNARKFAENGQEAFSLIERCHKPVIAAVNGYALGGGCELAMACHMRVASANAQFAQPEVNLGIIPGYGGTQRMTYLVGKGKAFELMMTGDMVSAIEAKELGLVNHVLSNKEDMMEKCFDIHKKIMQKAPLAINSLIDCVNAAYGNQENGYQTEANAFAICCKTEDFKEGTKAFIEKRPAKFTGG